MPPRKRARVSQASTPQPKSTTDTPAADRPSDKSDILNDPWTDDEEVLLFKSMIRWKPTGIHKHFRMLAISNALTSHGFNSPNTPHTRIPGIWAKLESLYDLDALDERENAHAGVLPSPVPSSPQEDAEAEEEEKHDTWNHEFELPDEDYGEMMWERRFIPEADRASLSPPLIDGLNYIRSEPGVDMSEIRGQYDHDEEEVASVKGKGKKTVAGKAVKGKGGRSTRSTPAEVEEDDDEDSEEGESQGGGSPAAKGGKKAAAKAKPARRTRRR